MILADSSIWVDYFRGANTAETARLDTLFGTNTLAVGDLIVAEVLQGFQVEAQFDEALALFKTLKIVRLSRFEIAVNAAKNFQVLRKKGFTTRKTIDTIIATFCITHEYELLHNDRDFLPFETYLGLKCVAC
jgi:predicted nucleic acid-binding protein